MSWRFAARLRTKTRIQPLPMRTVSGWAVTLDQRGKMVCHLSALPIPDGRAPNQNRRSMLAPGWRCQVSIFVYDFE
jgi:hypothetical protein